VTQASGTRDGVRWPHFGPHASRGRLVAGCRTLGGSHFVFDVRLRFAQYVEVVRRVAEEVLPKLRGNRRTPTN